jgi:GDPmannose 4,6-dehydratase
MAKTALITGVSGQDGAYLAKLLLEKGYAVHGTVRRHGQFSQQRLIELGIVDKVAIHDLELLEITNIQRVIAEVVPDEIYNFAAQSFVAKSFVQPIHTASIDGLGPLRILEALRGLGAKSRFYQASTSEMFGNVELAPQDENTPFHPRSPYAIAKLFAHWMTVNYRDAYGVHASSGISFNHESPLRGTEFVTRKISYGLARIKRGLQESIALGNLDSARDWGFAGDYVAGMWAMLQRPEPDDYVLASGEAHTVREFVERCGEALGMKIVWKGSGSAEIGVDDRTGQTVIKLDSQFLRPADVNRLIGNSQKAHKVLGWRPSVGFEELVRMMAKGDYDRCKVP